MADAYLASGRESMPALADVVDLTILDDVFERQDDPARS